MTPNEIANWIAIYVATGICCVLATAMSVLTVGREIVLEKVWADVTDWRSGLLLVPRIWWRWQKRYLLSTPVTLIIVSAFAITLDWN